MTRRHVRLFVIAGLLCRQPAFAQPSPFVVPPEFVEVTPFIRVLEAAGLKVQCIEDGQFGQAWAGIHASAFLETDRGDLKVVVLPKEIRIDRVSITYRHDDRRGEHDYRLNGIALKSEIRVVSGMPLYFTVAPTWLVQTRDASMDGLVKQALGQVRDEPETAGRAPR